MNKKYEFLSPKPNIRNKNNNILNNYNYINNNLGLNRQYFQNQNYNSKIEKLNNENILLSINNANFAKNNKILNQQRNLKDIDINPLKNIIQNINTKEGDFNKDNNSKDFNEMKKLEKMLEESNSNNIALKENIKKLNEEILSIKNNNKINLSLINQKNSKLEEMNNNINKLIQEKKELKKNNEEKDKKIVLLENELISSKKDLITKNDKINHLNDKYIELLAVRNKNRNIFEKEKQNEIIILKNKVEELEIKNNKINNDNYNLISKSEQQIQQIKKLELIIKDLNEKLKFNNKIEKNLDENENKVNLEKKKEDDENKNELNSLDSFEIIENKIKNKRPSTPSFKEIESPKDNLEEIEEYKDLKKLNDLLLNKIKEYESLLNINEVKKDIDKAIIEKNDNNIINNIKNNINNKENDMNYFKNKYIYYFQLYQENKKKIEILQIENETLNQKLNNNNNNLITTFSSIKLNYQYNPNEYFILCDKTYKQFKWYLMKKQSEYNQNDTYDNLIWVSSLDVVDIDKYNEYSNDEETDNTEMFNLIKKMEEKENLISKLSYKIQKLEKEVEQCKKNNINNSLYNNELFTENYCNSNESQKTKKNKSKAKIIKNIKNSINYDNDVNIINDNACVISFKKDLYNKEKNAFIKKIIKTEKDEIGVPLEKFNVILEKLNQAEAQFARLQKENIELRKNQRFYLSQNNNIVNIIPNNDDKEKIDNENNNCIINFSSDINKLTLMGNNFINNINDDGLGLLNNKNVKNNNPKEENENYKIKYKNLEKKLEMIKEVCKNILMKLKIPKKEKEETKQLLQYFDFTEEEILVIIGDKKNKKSKK